MSDLPTCSTLEACRRHDGRRVAVVGTYTPHDPYPAHAKGDLPVLARIALDDTEEGPFLGAFHDPAAARSEEERERLAGRRVRAVGVFHSVQPKDPGADPRAASFGGPCLQPVEVVEAVEQE